jgi:hypothetical protein
MKTRFVTILTSSLLIFSSCATREAKNIEFIAQQNARHIVENAQVEAKQIIANAEKEAQQIVLRKANSAYDNSDAIGNEVSLEDLSAILSEFRENPVAATGIYANTAMIIELSGFEIQMAGQDIKLEKKYKSGNWFFFYMNPSQKEVVATLKPNQKIKLFALFDYCGEARESLIFRNCRILEINN